MVAFCFQDLDCHAIKRVKKFALTGRLKNIDVKDASHGAMYPNVGSTISPVKLLFQYSLIVINKLSLQEHAYSNILKILQPKTENFQIKNSDIFHISAQNIDCGYSLELPW